MDDAGPITRLNARIHAAWDERLLQGIEALTALRLEEAREHLTLLAAELQAHAAREEAFILPKYERIGTFPRGASLEILDGDHRMLDKLAARAVAIVERLFEAPREDLRRQVVLHLDAFLRLRSVLEHHTLRETELMYPVLDDALDEDELRAALAALEPS